MGDTTTYTNLVFRPQIVDLTQYFNGDQTLIDSIQTWDDLVAYDPRFAQYVEYNTGEIVGVTPSVSVNNGAAITSPNELFAVGNAADEFEAVAGVTKHKIGSYTFDGTETWDVSSGAWFTTALANLAAFAPNKMILANSKLTGQMSASTSNAYSADGNCWLRSDTTYKRLYIIKSSITEPADMATYMTGVTVYFELAEPTTSTSTPTQISLQAGNNTAMQTDGGRLAPIDITYESDEL